jgi:hypothetical protein
MHFSRLRKLCRATGGERNMEPVLEKMRANSVSRYQSRKKMQQAGKATITPQDKK